MSYVGWFFMIFLKTGGKERPNISIFVPPNVYIYIHIYIWTPQGIIYRTFTRLHPLLSTPPYVHVYAYASWYAWAQGTNGSLGPKPLGPWPYKPVEYFGPAGPLPIAKSALAGMTPTPRCPLFLFCFFVLSVRFLQVPTEVGTRRIGSVGRLSEP